MTDWRQLLTDYTRSPAYTLRQSSVTARLKLDWEPEEGDAYTCYEGQHRRWYLMPVLDSVESKTPGHTFPVLVRGPETGVKILLSIDWADSILLEYWMVPPELAELPVGETHTIPGVPYGEVGCTRL